MIDEFVEACAKKGVVLDTNLLLLTFVGTHDRSLISRFKRTAKYAPEEFDAIIRLLTLFRVRATTPHVLTEVVDLASQLHEPVRERLLTEIRTYFGPLEERFARARDLAMDAAFPQIGLADSSVAQLCAEGFGLVTDDFPLANRLARRGMRVLNFNTIRPMLWE